MPVRLTKRKYLSDTTSSEYFGPEANACSIELYNALKDPYRAAPSNKIPVPMPHETSQPSPITEEILDKLENCIREVLHECRMTVFLTRATRLWQRNFQEKAKDTIIISTHDTDYTGWKDAAQLVFDIVEESAGPAGLQFRVEIRNPQRMYCDESDIVRSDTAALRTFQRIAPYVDAQVQKSCPTRWTSIAYHNRHPKGDKTDLTPTVLVFVWPYTNFKWYFVEEKIRSEIASVSVPDDIEVNVEILPGFITLL